MSKVGRRDKRQDGTGYGIVDVSNLSWLGWALSIVRRSLLGVGSFVNAGRLS